MGTSGDNNGSHIPTQSEKEGSVIIDTNGLEIKKLEEENKNLKDDNEALLKQIEQFNLDILPEKSVNSKKNNNKKISTNKIKNNFNSNEIKFTHSTGISTTIMVNDSTTVGEVITQLYTKMNIPKELRIFS